MAKTNTLSLDSVAVLALGMLYAGQNPGNPISRHVFELNGFTVLVAHKRLTVISAIGTRKDIGL